MGTIPAPPAVLGARPYLGEAPQGILQGGGVWKSGSHLAGGQALSEEGPPSPVPCAGGRATSVVTLRCRELKVGGHWSGAKETQTLGLPFPQGQQVERGFLEKWDQED